MRKADVFRQVVIYDRAKSAAEWRQYLPEVPLILSLPDTATTREQLLAFLDQTKAEVLDGDWAIYSRAMVEAARKAGAQVWPDLEIQPGAVQEECFTRIVNLGLTGAQTDEPEELIAWLKRTGRR